MSIHKKILLDASSRGSTSDAVVLSSETKIGLYVFSKSGESNNHRVGIEISPDGVNWMGHKSVITGQGYMFVDVVAAQVKVKVFEKEGKSSNINVHLLAI